MGIRGVIIGALVVLLICALVGVGITVLVGKESPTTNEDAWYVYPYGDPSFPYAMAVEDAVVVYSGCPPLWTGGTPLLFLSVVKINDKVYGGALYGYTTKGESVESYLYVLPHAPPPWYPEECPR